MSDRSVCFLYVIHLFLGELFLIFTSVLIYYNQWKQHKIFFNYISTYTDFWTDNWN